MIYLYSTNNLVIQKQAISFFCTKIRGNNSVIVSEELEEKSEVDFNRSMNSN